MLEPTWEQWLSAWIIVSFLVGFICSQSKKVAKFFTVQDFSPAVMVFGAPFWLAICIVSELLMFIVIAISYSLRTIADFSRFHLDTKNRSSATYPVKTTTLTWRGQHAMMLRQSGNNVDFNVPVKTTRKGGKWKVIWDNTKQ